MYLLRYHPYDFLVEDHKYTRHHDCGDATNVRGDVEDGHQRGSSCSYRLNTLNLAETRCIRKYGIEIFTCYRQVRHPRLLQACGYRLITHSIHYHCARDGARAGVVSPAAHVARYDAVLPVDAASIRWHTHHRRYCTSGRSVLGSQFSVPGSRFLVLSSRFPTTAIAAPSTLPVFGRAHRVLPGCSRYAS